MADTTRITTDSRFAVVPLWVIEEGSDRAVRLYAYLLAKYADGGGERAWPGRQTMADALGCSLDSIDRALRELVSIGAVSKRRRRDPQTGAQTSNEIVLHRLKKAAPVQRGGRTHAEGGSAPVRPEPDPLNQKVPTVSNETSGTPPPAPLQIGTVKLKSQLNGRPRDLIWDALVDELGDVATKSERGRRNAAVKELRDAGATPTQIMERCRIYRSEWPNVSLTASALAANWSLLEHGQTPSREQNTRRHLEKLRLEGKLT